MRYGQRVRNAIGLLAVLAMLLGPLLAHFEVVPPLGGFAAFALGGIVAAIVGLLSLVQLVRGHGLTAGGALGLIAAVGFVYIAVSQGGGHPRINDFTTDLADPPAFMHAQTIPQNAGRDMTYPKEWAAIQRECCADLHPAVLAMAPRDAHAKALAQAKAMPTWNVVAVGEDGANGLTIEAVSTSALFRFQDDVAIRVRPEGSGSKVDMRSKSRDGKGDMGVNTARIRSYIDALAPAK
jgi:uncharacterized protein (DUF1499 family)